MTVSSNVSVPPAATAAEELDQIVSGPMPVTFTNAGVATKYFVRNRLTIKNADGTVNATVNEYSTDGVTWNVAVPAGVRTLDFPYERDAVTSSPVLVCFNNAGVYTQYAVRHRFVINNEDGSIISAVTEYSADGTAWNVAVPAGAATIGACPLRYQAGGAQGVGVAPIALPNANVRSFTASAKSGTFDVSFDAGATWALTGLTGSRTWESPNEPLVNAANIRVRGTTAASTFDVIWEFKV